jgi:hypothetical protein
MKTWRTEYKGHTIEVTNRVFGERLVVDGELQDEHSGYAFRSRLWGRIRSGEGAGEIVKATLGGWFTVGCIVFVDDREIFRS